MQFDLYVDESAIKTSQICALISSVLDKIHLKSLYLPVSHLQNK